MTEAEMIAEIQQLVETNDNDDGMTFKELRDKTGLSDRQLTKALHAAADEDRLRTGRRIVTNIAGRGQSVPVYRIVE